MTAGVRVLGGLSILLAAGLWAGPASAQAGGPRIGLVLSGGAARGAAHVGVLRVLEELRIPIHAIAGTSMGAVVGGLYASGLSAERIERELTDLDWAAVFRDDIPREAVSFRRKEEQLGLLLDPELGLNLTGPRLPPGLVEGHRLGLLLDRLLLPVLGERDFDQLPIPFRATATDMETGELVVLDAGDLSEAVRASMAAPAAFSPVTIDGRVLGDGGIVRNLPLELVHALDVDVVIAVDVVSNLEPRESLNSVLGIASQTVMLVTQENTAASILAYPPDILLRPGLGDIPFTSFARSPEFIRRGYLAARAAQDTLRRWSVPADAYARWKAAVRRARGSTPVVDGVRVALADPAWATRIRRLVRIQPGQPLDLPSLRADLDRIYGLGLFDRVGFSIQQEPDSTTLVVEPVVAAVGPSTLRFGVALRDEPSGLSTFALLAHLLIQRVTPQGGEIRLEARAGEDRHVGGELYQPLAAGSPVFILTEAEHRRRFEVNPVPDVAASYVARRSRLGLHAGMHRGTWGQATVGLTFDRVVAGAVDGDAGLPTFDGWDTALTTRVTVDRLDDADFPGHGVLSRAELRVAPGGWGDVSSYAILNGRLSVARSRGPHSLVATAIGGAPLYGSPPFHHRFRLGGSPGSPSFAPFRALGEKLALGRLLYLHRLGRAGLARAGLAVELGDAWSGTAPSFPGGYSAGAAAVVAVRTVMGPVFAALGVDDRGRWVGRFALGQVPF